MLHARRGIVAALAATSIGVGQLAPAALAQQVTLPGQTDVTASAEAELSIRKEASRTTVQPG